MLMIVKVFGEVMIVTEVTVDHQVYGEVFNVVNKPAYIPTGTFFGRHAHCTCWQEAKLSDLNQRLDLEDFGF